MPERSAFELEGPFELGETEGKPASENGTPAPVTAHILQAIPEQSESTNMDNPNAIGGHSLQWQQAYKACAPTDSAQRDLVAQLAIPINVGQTREQAKRVDALSAQFSLMLPSTAGRLHARLISRGDALGQLFELSLHPLTQKLLLNILDATRRSNPPDRTADKHATENPSPPSKRMAAPKPPVPTPLIPKPRIGPTKPPPVRVPQTHIDRLFNRPDPKDPGSWVLGPLIKAAGLIGVTLSVELRTLSPALVAKAVDAAWMVFQLEDRKLLTSLYGAAGEAAAEAILPELLGLDPALVKNLNDYATSFPRLDVASSSTFFSIKVRAAASSMAGDELKASLLSQYTSDLFDMTIHGPESDRKWRKAANGLIKIKPALGRSWPADLVNLNPEAVHKYLRKNARLLIPHNHVNLLRSAGGESLAMRIKSSKKLMDELRIKNQLDMVNFVNRQIDKIGSLQLTTQDFESIAETAGHHIPREQVPRLLAALERLKIKREMRLKLDD